MAVFTNYLTNKFIDLVKRGQSFTPAATLYYGMIVATKGGRANSVAYSLNDTIHLTANDGKPHLYKCTTAGTSASSQGSLYPGAANEVITDGTAAFTEQTSALLSATSGAINEPTIGTGAYARVSVTSNMTNWAGTQSAGSTSASSGTSGTTSNNTAITFPAPTSAWAAGSAQVAGWVAWDASSSGNACEFGLLTTPKTVNNGDPAPSFAIGALSLMFNA